MPLGGKQLDQREREKGRKSFSLPDDYRVAFHGDVVYDLPTEDHFPCANVISAGFVLFKCKL